MPPPDSDSLLARRILIVDTGPIWELVLYRAVHELGFDGLRRELKYFRTSEAYQHCGSFLSSFRNTTTSASVAAELYRRIRKTEPQRGHEDLWRIVYEEFKSMRMGEEVVKLLDMDIELVTRYGPTDVSLLELARRSLGYQPVILTLDHRLHAECMKARISSRLLRDVCDPIRPRF